MKIFSILPRAIIAFLLFFSISLTAQQHFNPDTVQAGKFDNGKMWTFDYPPAEYLSATYDFKPDDSWFEDVRLSALRIPGCTASFVSEDGLIMTNHHCAEGLKSRIEKEGENIEEDGFYAPTLEDERKVENYYADQLVLIKDVTDEVEKAFNSAETEEQKVTARDAKISELEEKYNEETGLRCRVYPLFNGGKYSLYGYKRYEDLRVVFIPETKIGYFGGDYDNFTYPRYNLDCSFLRIYDEDGKPLKTENFFKFNPNGAPKDDVIFTVGNPGTTRRLKTVSQLEYYRDVAYRNYAFYLDNYYAKLTSLQKQYPDRFDELEKIKAKIGNGQKSIGNTYKGLVQPYLIARKAAFENELKSKVKADPELDSKYGHVWDAIADTRAEMQEIGPKIAAYSSNRYFRTDYFKMAKELVTLAKQLELPEAERKDEYKSAMLDSTINSIYPEDFDRVLQDAKLGIQLDFIALNLGKDNDEVTEFFGNFSGDKAAKVVLDRSILTSKEKVLELAKEGADAILDSDDPIIKFVADSREDYASMDYRADEITKTESVFENLLGQAMFEVYGTQIPPDANFTLRLSDGMLKSFDYNGTIAPVKTTFYGMYDRWNGFDKEYPWELPERWINPQEGFDMSTPFNFISTNDIVGGNSGSPIIDRNAEVVGLAFDGNIKSLFGTFIYMENDNRCVAVSSKGMLHAFKFIYKADNLAKELSEGKISK